MKNTPGIYSVMWWKFHLLSYEKTHTEYHPFLCLKKGRGKFIPNSSILNSYLYSQKSHFHELNGWKTGPMSPTVSNADNVLKLIVYMFVPYPFASWAPQGQT